VEEDMHCSYGEATLENRYQSQKEMERSSKKDPTVEK